MLFARGLLEACRQRGATVLTGRAVRALKAGADGITHAETDAGPLAADAFVVCLGIAAPALVKPFGIALPIYPVKGYSMTLPITDPSRAPRMGGVDENNLLAYCPMGQRLRITATAEIAGYDDSHRPADFTRMLERTRAVFPAGIDYGRAEMWAGLRPMTPTGMPVIDRTHIANLFLNAGHGHVGWTMSNGSARVLADLVGQRQPAIAMDGMRL
ncbi:MAG: FAD-dependent oxidoreductase [Hyphomicrobiaceae bacterium]